MIGICLGEVRDLSVILNSTVMLTMIFDEDFDDGLDEDLEGDPDDRDNSDDRSDEDVDLDGPWWVTCFTWMWSCLGGGYEELLE